VIVEIFVAKRERVDSLPDQLLHAMLDQVRIPKIDEALTEPGQQVHFRVSLLQQQTTSVGTDCPATELRHDLAASADAGKPEPILVTLCHNKGRFLSRQNMS
jgi:hypothetical protein